MSADFYASYLSGALGIIIGNRLDIIKTELQAGNRAFVSTLVPTAETSRLTRVTSLFRGAAAPVLGYGALNSILFVTYNRTLTWLDPGIDNPTKLAGVDLGKIWLAGAVGGVACWIIDTPTEMIKCRTQLRVDGQASSYATARAVIRDQGLSGLYQGGLVTALRDSFGYAWYFWTYELTKRLLLSRQADPFIDPTARDILLSGGIAGVVTWASVFPLDVIKTRLQTQNFQPDNLTEPLIEQRSGAIRSRTTWQITSDVLRTEGLRGFYRGLGICSIRAFIVNAAQFFIYEEAMKLLNSKRNQS